eukprot:7610951-Lingulodinium_polyedra.AAC.1
MFYARDKGSKHDAQVASVASVCSGTPRRLVGTPGVYVDDFLVVESEDPEWKDLMTKIKGLVAVR